MNLNFKLWGLGLLWVFHFRVAAGAWRVLIGRALRVVMGFRVCYTIVILYSATSGQWNMAWDVVGISELDERALRNNISIYLFRALYDLKIP